MLKKFTVSFSLKKYIIYHVNIDVYHRQLVQVGGVVKILRNGIHCRTVSGKCLVMLD